MAGRGVYTHGHHQTVLSSHRWRTVENSAAYLVDHLRSGARVLDVGCGPGTITVGLAERAAPGHVTGLDASEQVVKDARRYAAERGIGNVTFVTGDVYALAFPDGVFDVVHAHQVLQHLDDPVRALREMRRVCRPGGVVAARDADFGAMAWYPEPPDMDAWLPVYSKVARGNGGEPDAGRRLVSWARQAGFTDITATSSSWCFSTPEERRWWSESWGGRMVRSSIADTAVSRGHATRDELDRIYAGWRQWAAADDGWFTVTHGEIVCRVP
ncbi:hypothetical protein Arub01_37080 [Actinomadura rubrobrunea]|uniref:Methyltransferase domain-containing protein n=1 Tax=Actinomadura rubrobrunea TaxID=115335 RepID=A0A9W6UVU6_9ACTN|nr:methyltransferase domain-containing protein [Actinomadura rubrobrunea]GLW65464.1 hypothetical protein Arub01_37080 [Actinomadura rubrobrunea]